MRRRPTFVLLLTAALLLGGCTLGEASTFRGRANHDCAQTARANVTLVAPPADAHAALRHAIDRYQNMDRLVGQISEDVAFPGGSTGRALSDGWIDPARASLRHGRDALIDLRDQVEHGPSEAVPAGFAPAIASGTLGVDTDLLRRQGLADCAAAFTAPSTTAG